jgi:hypothetical protein
MATAGDAVRLVFDKERKLKARHKYIRNAVITSGKSIQALLADPFGGFPYVLQALIQPGVASNETISLDKASDLIDLYMDKGGTTEQLQAAMVQCVQSYMRIEGTPTPEETDDPNGDSPAAPGT